jgi:TPR repeat protein
VPKDYIKAANFFNSAAEQGVAEAQRLLASMYRFGIGVQTDYAKSVQLFEMASKQGDDSAQYHLGLMYLTGVGVVRNEKTGCDLLYKSAGQDNKNAIDDYNKYCTRR